MKQHVFRSQSTRPWSPLSVSLITLFLPAGGAALTIQNLVRLQTSGTSAWTSGVLTALIYQLLAILITVPIGAGVAARMSARVMP